MPTYDYKCDHCNNVFEFFQSMKDDPMTLCPQCGHNSLKKMVSLPAGLIFKGTGFYLTDYKKNNSSPSVINKTQYSSKSSEPADTNNQAKTESKEKKTESKEKKTDSKKNKGK
jgi:putative FmdB family regulatory protein